MKKNLSLILIIIVSMSAALTLTSFSCSSDKDDDIQPADVVGEWYLSHIQEYWYYEGERKDFEASYSEEATFFIKTASDGTGSVNYAASPTMEFTYDFTWSMSGNKVTVVIQMEDEVETDVFTITDLTATTLKIQLKGTDEEGPYESNYTLTKIR